MVGEILRFEAPRPTLTLEVTIRGEAKFTLVQSGPGFQEFRADTKGKFTFGGDLTLDDGSGKRVGWSPTNDAGAGGAGEVTG